MRRTLVLGDESARHPFLKTLPPHVRTGQAPVSPHALLAMRAVPPRGPMARRALAFGRHLGTEAADMAARHADALAYRLRRARRSWIRPQVTARDTRDFLMAYCACFVAISAFIA